MRFMRGTRAMAWGVLGAAAALGLAVAAVGVPPDAKRESIPEAPAPAAPLVVGDTRANLQNAFDQEMNAKERYLAAAKQADQEGYRYVAQLFRACARAEQVHADRHVHAIAWTGGGGEAKALLQRLALGTTAENLRASIDLETYEATQFYPALLARARAEHLPAAARSMNFALAAEREHARLLAAVLETLDQRPATRTFYVCPMCGKTVESRGFKECPNCFTRAGKFIRVD